VTPDIGSKDGLAGGVYGKAGRNASLSRISQLNFSVIRQFSVLEFIPMKQFLTCPTAKQAVAIRGKLDSVEGFLHPETEGYRLSSDVHNDDLMGAVASVQYGGKLPARVKRDIHREIA
jgi:hypothetical protein